MDGYCTVEAFVRFRVGFWSLKLHIKVKDDEEFEESLVSEIFFHPIILMKTGFINSVQQLLRGDETEQNIEMRSYANFSLSL